MRANKFVPTSLPIYYFEVEVISKGREGYIGVGFCTQDVNMDRLPGWEPQSYGYHGDDGNAFRSDGKGRKYGPQFGTGAPSSTQQYLYAICYEVSRTGCRIAELSQSQ